MNGQQLTREIGKSGVSASAVGLGTWAIGGWMWGGTDEAESIAAIQASLDAGVTLIDTAPAYGLGRSEEIVGKALTGRRDKAVIATKCGLVWHTQKGRHFFDQDGKPVHRYLGGDAILHGKLSFGARRRKHRHQSGDFRPERQRDRGCVGRRAQPHAEPGACRARA